MYCDLLTIGTWGHPSPPRHADVLNGWSLTLLFLHSMSVGVKVFELSSIDGSWYKGFPWAICIPLPSCPFSICTFTELIHNMKNFSCNHLNLILIPGYDSSSRSKSTPNIYSKMPTIISEPEIKPRNSNSDSGMDYYKRFDSVVKPKNSSVSVPDIDSYLGKDLTIHNTLWRKKNHIRK